MRSYDEIYQYFIRHTRVDSLDLPSDIPSQIHLIHDGVIEFNIWLRIGLDRLIYDDTTEELSEDMQDELFVFLSECMTLSIYKNMLSEFVSTWEVFQNDVGRKYYKDQLNGRQELVKEQEHRLKTLRLAISDEYVDTEEGAY